MDVNGTRFQLLLGAADWARCTDERGRTLAHAPGLAWNAQLCELTLQSEVFEFPAGAGDVAPRLEDRRGAGRDVFGNWYAIAPDSRSILVTSAGDHSIATFWPGDETCAEPLPRPGTFAAATPAPPARAGRLCGAAVTTDHFLAVGTLDPPGLLVFDLETGGPPLQLPWRDTPFAPFDLAARPGGGVFVLDRDNRLAWELDRHFHVESRPVSPPAEPFAFVPVSGDAPPATASPLTEASAVALGGDPIAIEAAPGGGFLILDGAASLLTHFADGVQVGAAASLPVDGFDLAVAGSTVYVVDFRGNQAYAFDLTLGEEGPQVELEQQYFPMRRFGGKGLVAAGARTYYDFGDRWIPLVRQPRSRHVETGTVVTPVLDGAEPGCVWHRLLVDAALPPGSSLLVWSRAADEEAGLDIAPWLPEPAPRARTGGAEIPYVELGPYATHELLFQAAVGRYLQVKLELVGDGRVSPRVRALRAWFPRFSYLDRYLPAVYREDDASASFLDRYLANVEGMSTSLEDRIAAAQVLLSPETVPSESLDWLAGWLALAFDPLWDESRRRLFLENAMTFYAARGTIRGVELLLRFTLDRCLGAKAFSTTQALGGARIVETFRTRRTPGVVFGDPTDLAPLRIVTRTARWSPAQGRDALNAAYEAATGQPEYPIADPGGEASAAWRSFSQETLGFVPAAPDPAAWRAFLAHRYSNPAAVLAAYGSTGTAPEDFSGLTAPAGPGVPPDGPPLLDWFQFQSVVLPMAAKAHRFSVLLPWPLHVYDSTHTELTHEQLRDLAQRIVEVQKPAHTLFDVKFFWSAFRIGEARLGDDTLLATGSRVPELIEPAVLGRDYIGTSILAGPPTGDAIRRFPVPSPPPEEAP